MMSGATLFEHCVELSRRPELLQRLFGLTARPVGTTKPLVGVKPGPAPFEAKPVCGDSTDTANQPTLPTSSTKRIAGVRFQLKPATYCASMVSGMFSVPFRMPVRFCVAKLHI